MSARWVLFKVGSTFEEVARERGDYDLWFREGLGPLAEGRLDVLRTPEGDALPDVGDHAAIVVSGSGAMVTDRERWSVELAAFLCEAVARRIPTLGVCYGHQLLADALGGRVDYNPNGRQVGTVEATLTHEANRDPLLSDMPRPMVVQTSHSQCVIELPPGAVLLARSPRDGNHAFRCGDSAWGVQFHPEFDGPSAREYVARRMEAIRAEGDDPEALLAGIRDSDHGRAVLRRFARIAADQG